MIEDVYEPLSRYRDEFQAEFARHTSERFAQLVEESGVDAEANRRLVAAVRRLEASAASLRCRRGWLWLLTVLGFAVAIGLGMAVYKDAIPDGVPAAEFVIGAVAGGALGVALLSHIAGLSRRIAALEAEARRKRDEAWEQMAPLNRLYTWDMTARLIEATVPRIAFDPYFTVSRLASLRGHYGWDDDFNDGKSILFAQSGEINGNPFVFGQYLGMEWGAKTYVGHCEISWTEWETDANGRRRLVRRYETLTAEVTKPIPQYYERKFLVYGNDAAPALSFSREPSGMHGEAHGLFERLRRRRRLKKLEAYSRNLTDDSDFTLMANREFETWFHAKDRDNEVEFRLLFTPVAQTQMLALMKDEEVGYGDDFAFTKNRKINLLHSTHLDAATLDTDPARFQNWDIDAAAAEFSRFNERYFKDAYFSLAPLLAIPLYQQTRTHADILAEFGVGEPSSFWEHESIANYFGEEAFRHPQCVTRCILKTEAVRREGGECAVAVTAHGFEGVERVDVVEVLGGDGNWHGVEVPWTDYLPVERTREVCLTELPTPREEFRRCAEEAEGSAARRSILSYLSD